MSAIPQNNTHYSSTAWMLLSNLLQQGAFYSVRTVIVIYATSGLFSFSQNRVYEVYAAVFIYLGVMKFFGGVLGDLLLGSKRAIILGGVLQAAGAFTLCATGTSSFFIGIVLFTIGIALYEPNINANFGKMYRNKPNSIDAMFILLVFTSTLAYTLILPSSSKLDAQEPWTYAFVLSGTLAFLSIIPIIFTKSYSKEEMAKEDSQRMQIPTSTKVINLFFSLLAIGVFWMVYEIFVSKVYNLPRKFGNIELLGLSSPFWLNIGTTLLIWISIALVFIWGFVKSPSFLKLTIGVFCALFGFILLFSVSEEPTSNAGITMLLSLSFLCIAEASIGGVVRSIITQSANPKYLGMFMGLSYIPFYLFLGMFKIVFSSDFQRDSTAQIIGLVLLFILVVLFTIWTFASAQEAKKLNQKNDSAEAN